MFAFTDPSATECFGAAPYTAASARTSLLSPRVVPVAWHSIEAIDGGSGRVKVGDSVWTANGPDTPAGARVRIIGISGTKLKVEAA